MQACTRCGAALEVEVSVARDNLFDHALLCHGGHARNLVHERSRGGRVVDSASDGPRAPGRRCRSLLLTSLSSLAPLLHFDASSSRQLAGTCPLLLILHPIHSNFAAQGYLFPKSRIFSFHTMCKFLDGDKKRVPYCYGIIGNLYARFTSRY